MTRFSIIIPIYNAEAYLAKSIESALRQDAGEYEIILINDGSTDRSAELCRKYLSDPRIVYYEQDNRGQSAARNRALDAARGEYVVFLDADDYLTENCLGEVYRFMKRQDLDVATFNQRCYFADYTFYQEKRPRHISPGECWDGAAYIQKFGFQIGVTPWLYIYRRMFLESRPFRFSDGLFHEDCEWTAHWFPYVKRYGYLDLCVYNQVFSPFSTIRSRNIKKSRDLIEISALIHRDAEEARSISDKCAEELHRYAAFEAWSSVHSCCAMGFTLSELLTSEEIRERIVELMKGNQRYAAIRWLLCAKMDFAVEAVIHMWHRLKKQNASTALS